MCFYVLLAKTSMVIARWKASLFLFFPQVRFTFVVGIFCFLFVTTTIFFILGVLA